MELLARVWVGSSDLLAYFQATDEFNNSSGGNSALIVGVVLVIAIGAVVLTGLKAWERMRSRARVIRTSAERNGFDFVETEQRVLPLLRFDVFMEATGFEPTSVVTKKLPDGRRVFAFDYQLINVFELYKTPDGQTHRRRKGDPNTIGGAAIGRAVDHLDVRGAAATINLSSFLRNVVVQPLDWHVSNASRLSAEPPIESLDPAFNAQYRVRSDDRDFATRFINPKLTEMLLRTGGIFGLEVRGNHLLLFANEIAPSDMCDMALLVGICADLIDNDLLLDFPEVIGIESDGSPRLAVRQASADPTFPAVEVPAPSPGPVLPDTLSGRTIPILSSEPQLPIDEATMPAPRPDAPSAPPDDAPVTSGAPTPQEAEVDNDRAPQPTPPPPPPPTPTPAPDSVDWSL